MLRTSVVLAGLGAASAFVAPGALPMGASKVQLRSSAVKTSMAMPTVPFDSVTPTGASGPTLPGDGDLDFLEATPYWDQSGVKVNISKQKDPLVGKILSVQRMVGPKAPGETCNIVIDHRGELPYWEGQSYGVLPPGIDPKKNKPYGVRLYSIASTRYGDDKTGKTTTLCVRRATYWDPEMKAEDPAKKGVCSNYLCDAQPGDEVKITGPSGKVMLMPEEDPNMTYIMVATGTGIAPYRTFLRRLFGEATPAGKNFQGLAWLFLGVANKDSLLYDEEFQTYLRTNPDKMRLDYALSREGPLNKKGGKMYIQDKVEEYSDEVTNNCRRE
jgi:ferredoxin--NADP+ reductase